MNHEVRHNFNLQNVRENKASYGAENIKFVSKDQNVKKSPHLFILIFYTLLKVYCHVRQRYFAAS